MSNQKRKEFLLQRLEFLGILMLVMDREVPQTVADIMTIGRYQYLNPTQIAAVCRTNRQNVAKVLRSAGIPAVRRRGRFLVEDLPLLYGVAQSYLLGKDPDMHLLVKLLDSFSPKILTDLVGVPERVKNRAVFLRGWEGR